MLWSSITKVGGLDGSGNTPECSLSFNLHVVKTIAGAFTRMSTMYYLNCLRLVAV